MLSHARHSSYFIRYTVHAWRVRRFRANCENDLGSTSCANRKSVSRLAVADVFEARQSTLFITNFDCRRQTRKLISRDFRSFKTRVFDTSHDFYVTNGKTDVASSFALTLTSKVLTVISTFQRLAFTTMRIRCSPLRVT